MFSENDDVIGIINCFEYYLTGRNEVFNFVSIDSSSSFLSLIFITLVYKKRRKKREKKEIPKSTRLFGGFFEITGIIMVVEK